MLSRSCLPLLACLLKVSPLLLVCCRQAALESQKSLATSLSVSLPSAGPSAAGGLLLQVSSCTPTSSLPEKEVQASPILVAVSWVYHYTARPMACPCSMLPVACITCGQAFLQRHGKTRCLHLLCRQLPWPAQPLACQPSHILLVQTTQQLARHWKAGSCALLCILVCLQRQEQCALCGRVTQGSAAAAASGSCFDKSAAAAAAACHLPWTASTHNHAMLQWHPYWCWWWLEC